MMAKPILSIDDRVRLPVDRGGRVGMGFDGDHRSDTDRLDEWLTEEGIKN